MPRKGESMTEAAKAKQRTTIAARGGRSGDRNANWKGGRIHIGGGRVAVYASGHPGARLYGGTHILAYRLIAEGKIGRPLHDDEVVHHIDGDPTNNHPDNLEVMTQAEHAARHADDRRDPATGRFLQGVSQ